MNTPNPLVEKQYTDWVFPEPIADITAWTAQNYQPCDPSLHHALIWPDRGYDTKIDILVAGCGTSQAAILAYTNPEATVVGIDLSPASLDCSARLKAKHNLKNLELHRMDLYRVSDLKRRFDLVYCTGVLHHLPDPQKGLESIASVVKDDGVLCLMLYAKYGRTGVYMVQEALRRMDIGQTPADLMLTRHVISSLPAGHPVQPYIRGAACELAYDGGMVDTFLHRQDRAYTVPDILALTAATGLRFQGWIDNLDYYPDGAIPADHPIHQRITALPEEEQWAVMELLVQLLGCHCFFLRKKNGGEEKSRIDFNSPDFLQRIPARRHMLKAADQDGVTQVSRSWHNLRIGGFERDLFLSIDGETDCGDIIAGHASGKDGREQTARRFFAHMWRLGHLTFHYPF